MTRLTAFGLFAVTAMLLCYALEDRSRWFIFIFCSWLRSWFRLRIPAGRLAVWHSRSSLDNRCAASLVENRLIH
jgi:hypothetical protein